jgi:iron-sulfur cluster assembly protein
MLDVTESALKEFKKLIADSHADGSRIRIFASGGGCCGPSYGLDVSEKGETGDKLLNKDGLDIYIDPAASDGLDAATIDYIENGPHKGFVIQGLPKSSCC